jgi:hypothetical protein
MLLHPSLLPLRHVGGVHEHGLPLPGHELGLGGGFLGGHGRNFAMTSGSGSGLGATARGPGTKRGGQPTDSAFYPRRHKPHPNLGRVCITVDS